MTERGKEFCALFCTYLLLACMIVVLWYTATSSLS